ncbi:MAG: tetratricopeptide repeat protein [Methylococcaceae bacterium]
MTLYQKKIKSLSLSRCNTLLLMTLVIVACTDQKEKSNDHLSKTAEYINKGELEKARIELKASSQSGKDTAETYYYMALLNEKKRQFKEMKENLLKTVELAPSFIDARIKLGKVQLLFGDNTEAMSQAEYVLKDASQNLEALTLKASALIKQKNITEALTIIDDILKEHPDNTDALSLKSLIFMEKGDFSKALTLIDAAKKSDASNIGLDFFKIQLDAKNKNTDAVIVDYKNLANAYPDNNEFKITLAKIYTQTGKVTEAEALLQNIINAEPNNIQSILMFLDFTAATNKEKLIDKFKLFSEQHKEQPRILLTLANWMTSRKYVVEAETNLNQVIKIEKNSNVGLAAKVELAKIALETGSIEKSKKIIDSILTTNSSFDDANVLKARILLTQGQSDEAITFLNKVIWSKENSEEAQMLLAQTYLMKGDNIQADIHFLSTLSANPANLQAVLYAYDKALTNNDLKLAKDIIQKALSLIPNNIQFLEKNANLNIIENDWNTAKLTVQKITNTNSPLAFDLASYFLGRIHQGEGNFTKAIEIYSEILERLPDNNDILINIAQCYEKLNNRNQLIVFLNNLRVKNPHNITAGTLLAEAYLANKNIDIANNLLNKMITDKLNKPQVYVLLANVKLAMNDNQGALDAYLDGLKIFPNNIKLSTSAANQFVKLGNFDAAVACYEALLEKNENLDIAINNLAVILAENYSSIDKLNQAALLAGKLKDSTQPYYKDTYAWILVKQKKISDGIKILNKLIMANPNIPIFRYHLGAAYYELGNNSSAINEIKQAIELSKKTNDFFDKKTAEVLLAEILDKTRGHSLVIN